MNELCLSKRNWDINQQTLSLSVKIDIFGQKSEVISREPLDLKMRNKRHSYFLMMIYQCSKFEKNPCRSWSDPLLISHGMSHIYIYICIKSFRIKRKENSPGIGQQWFVFNHYKFVLLYPYLFFTFFHLILDTYNPKVTKSQSYDHHSPLH